MRVLREMIKSKKFWYAVVAFIVSIVGFINPEVAGLTEQLLYGLIALILGQGMADINKEAEKIKKG